MRRAGCLTLVVFGRGSGRGVDALFPSFNVRSSGGLWSPFLLPWFPSRSSAGERAGRDGVNQNSDRGSCLTCARDRVGMSVRSGSVGSCPCSKSCRLGLRTKLLPLRKRAVVVDIESFRIDPGFRVIYGDGDGDGDA